MRTDDRERALSATTLGAASMSEKCDPSDVAFEPSHDVGTQNGGVKEGQPLELIKSTASKTANQLTGALTRTLSKVRTSDTLDLGPPPDGGFRAWFSTILTHLTLFNSWGFINSFGVFQTYYVETMHLGAPSAVSWIGTITVFILFGMGMFSGRALDAGFFHLFYILGSVIYLFGMFMLSISTKYYQVFLAQGVCMGIGYGFVFVPSLALTSTYFLKNRSTAIGICVMGSCTGGVVFPAMAERLLPTVGFGWTIRIMAFVQMFGAILCACFMKPRLPPRRSGPVVEWTALKEPAYILYLCTGYFFFWSVYIGFFYIGTYGTTIVGTSQTTAFNLLLLLNGVGALGRIASAVLAQKIGGLNILLPSIAACGVLGYSWIAVKSEGGLWAFTVVYGLVASVLQGLWPVVLTSLTTNQKKAGARAGMGFAWVGVAVLTGPPIGGALVQQMNGSFLGCQIFAGTAMFVSAGFALLTRIAILKDREVPWSWIAKV